MNISWVGKRVEARGQECASERGERTGMLAAIGAATNCWNNYAHIYRLIHRRRQKGIAKRKQIKTGKRQLKNPDEVLSERSEMLLPCRCCCWDVAACCCCRCSNSLMNVRCQAN